MTIYKKNIQNSILLHDKIDLKFKTIIFKIVKEYDGVAVKMTYDYANNYTNNNNDINDINYEMCQINIDLSCFRELTLEDLQNISLKSNMTEIVNKFNNNNDILSKEYYIIFYN